MQDEFDRLVTTFGWSPEDVARVNEMAIDAAFASDDVKHRVRDAIRSAYGIST